jgi:hypothetical protein
MGGICLSKRDWRRINMVLVGEADRTFRIAKKIVWEEPEPWIWKPKYKNDNKRRVGRPPEFMARPLVMLCLWRIYSGKSYRWMEGYPQGNTQLRHEVGLGDEWPAYETIRRAMFYLDEAYLRRLNKRILAEPRRTSAEGKP